VQSVLHNEYIFAWESSGIEILGSSQAAGRMMELDLLVELQRYIRYCMEVQKVPELGRRRLLLC